MSRRTNARVLLSAAVLIAGVVGTVVVVDGLPATSAEKTPSPASAPRAVPVEIAQVEAAPVRLWRSYSAQLAPVDLVELRPQVSGRIVEVKFSDGDMVKQGDVLFVIDPAPYQAAVDQAKADLAAARNNTTYAQQQFTRAQHLIKTSAIPASQLDERKNALAVTRNQVLAAKARLETAKINLNHAYVMAPIDGRVSRAEVTVGNLVQAGAQAPLLTTIVSQAGIYADFNVDEATYVDFVRSTAHDVAAERKIPVRMSLGSGGGTVFEGHIHSFDNRIDPTTGTIRARALFDNADGSLLPGMFAQVQLGSAAKRDVILLSEGAVLTDQDRKFVYVVGPGDKATYRQVELGAAVGDKRVVTEGLKSGDRVIVGGLMAVRPNVVVTQKQAAAAQPADDSKVATAK